MPRLNPVPSTPSDCLKAPDSGGGGEGYEFFFLSYCREDHKIARLALEAADTVGIPLWFDLENIPPAADWNAEIHAALSESVGLIFVVSQYSVDSPFVDAEWQQCLASGKPVFALLVDNTSLPPALAEFDQTYVADLRSDPISVDKIVPLFGPASAQQAGWRRPDQISSDESHPEFVDAFKPATRTLGLALVAIVLINLIGNHYAIETVGRASGWGRGMILTCVALLLLVAAAARFPVLLRKVRCRRIAAMGLGIEIGLLCFAAPMCLPFVGLLDLDLSWVPKELPPLVDFELRSRVHACLLVAGTVGVLGIATASVIHKLQRRRRGNSEEIEGKPKLFKAMAIVLFGVLGFAGFFLLILDHLLESYYTRSLELLFSHPEAMPLIIYILVVVASALLPILSLFRYRAHADSLGTWLPQSALFHRDKRKHAEASYTLRAAPSAEPDSSQAIVSEAVLICSRADLGFCDYLAGDIGHDLPMKIVVVEEDDSGFEDELARAAVAIVILSPYLTSRLPKPLQLSEQTRLIPVLLQSTSDVPEVFGRYQRIDARRDYEGAVADLAEQLQDPAAVDYQAQQAGEPKFWGLHPVPEVVSFLFLFAYVFSIGWSRIVATVFLVRTGHVMGAIAYLVVATFEAFVFFRCYWQRRFSVELCAALAVALSLSSGIVLWDDLIKVIEIGGLPSWYAIPCATLVLAYPLTGSLMFASKRLRQRFGLWEIFEAWKPRKRFETVLFTFFLVSLGLVTVLIL